MKQGKNENKKTRKRGRDFIIRLIWGILAIMMLAGVSFTLIFSFIRS